MCIGIVRVNYSFILSFEDNKFSSCLLRLIACVPRTKKMFSYYATKNIRIKYLISKIRLYGIELVQTGSKMILAGIIYLIVYKEKQLLFKMKNSLMIKMTKVSGHC